MNLRHFCQVLLIFGIILMGLTEAIRPRRRYTPKPRRPHPYLSKVTASTELDNLKLYQTFFASLKAQPSLPTTEGTGAVLRGPQDSASGEDDTTCRRRNQVLPYPEDPTRYKICVPMGRNWMQYNYKCPDGTEYRRDTSKCANILRTTNIRAETGVPSPQSPIPSFTESANLEKNPFKSLADFSEHLVKHQSAQHSSSVVNNIKSVLEKLSLDALKPEVVKNEAQQTPKASSDPDKSNEAGGSEAVIDSPTQIPTNRWKPSVTTEAVSSTSPSAYVARFPDLRPKPN